MGNFMSRQNAAVEEADQTANHAYKYPPRMGNFFGTHFIMGGERFDTPQPESYLFGENSDLNFLGNRPTAFPYPPPQANEPTKTLKSLINIRKESVRFVRVPQEKKLDTSNTTTTHVGDAVVVEEEIDGNVLCSMVSSGGDVIGSTPCSYNIEFTFDSDAKCAITIYYFCSEEVSPSGVTLVPRDGLTSETYHYEKGINQYFSQPSHVFNPQLIPEDDLIYNPTKEQYPVAIHCVVEEGNEDCRQSHTTVCVIDHHPETNSYVLRALKQKLFVDGLCYLLQEIYGIENKAVNKSSIDEEIDDHGSECVICMSETRDTLILPCRHLCLCNSCADSLRYQANNCPICRAPFRALLQIRAVQKGVSTHVLHSQNTTTSGAASEPAACDVPPGYVPVSLIEALNGPPQYVGRTRNADNDVTDCVSTTALSGSGISSGVIASDNNKATSPLKPNSQRRPKIKKNASTCTTTSEVGTITNTSTNTNENNSSLSVVEIESDPKKTTSSASSTSSRASPVSNKETDNLQIVNERQSLKLPKTKRNSSNNCNNLTGYESVGVAISATALDNDDDDSENEKLSPLLSPGSKSKSTKTQSSKTLKQVVADLNADGDEHDDNSGRSGNSDCGTNNASDDVSLKETTTKSRNASVKKPKRPDLHHTTTTSTTTIATSNTPLSDAAITMTACGLNADDSDYYTPEDTQNSILSPLCPPVERAKSGEHLCNAVGGGVSGGSSISSNHKANNVIGGGSGVGGVVVGFSGGGVHIGGAANNLVKKNLHKKSTSVGNIAGPGATTDLKCNNVSSLPDMLDSPISGNSASTRSSSDSYSSSSSTKQLLSSNPTTAAANIIVDDKTALQNAVNV